MWLLDRIFGRKDGHVVKTEYAPFRGAIYQSLIDKLKSHHTVNITAFNSHSNLDNRQANVYFRHDIDTLNCVKNLPSLVEIDEKNGIVPGIFFLVSNETYLLSSCKEIANYLHQQGFPVGLHTVCYLNDDYLDQFQREIDIFTDTFGFRPDTFNAHGLGTVRLETRLKFYDEIAVRYQEFGFQYSDCCPKLREYRHVFEDCHWDKEKSSRYLKKDFFDPLSSLEAGNVLVLTHPCYWTL